MKVERLEAAGFRNLEDASLIPCAGVNVIRGDNAQGKTNLLEAVWLFTGGVSFRGAKDSEYIGFGKPSARLSLIFHAGGRTQSAEITIGPQGRQARLNGISASRAQLCGKFCAVVFSPAHLDIVKSGPKNRRALIDGSLCQAYPKYVKILESYSRILRQRSYLLKEGKADGGLLDVWDKSLAEYGGYITWMRIRYVKKLADYGALAYCGISGGREDFCAYYRASWEKECGNCKEEARREEITGRLAEEIYKSRENDIRHGRTNIGPHRDDVEIEIGGKSARIYGSQGQQRSCVLALKLAECKILEESAKEHPVVLLDDVMSELDEGRRLYLLNNLDGRQVFITCCGDLPSAADNGRIFAVKSGVIM